MNDGLTERHHSSLSWFSDSEGRSVPWPSRSDTGGELVFSSPKGIYKPAWSNYALRIRQTLNSPYADLAPSYFPDSSWLYLYHQEGWGEEDQALFTNRGLFACMEDRVPVGVAIQESTSPARYRILGTGFVHAFDRGYF